MSGEKPKDSTENIPNNGHIVPNPPILVGDDSKNRKTNPEQNSEDSAKGETDSTKDEKDSTKRENDSPKDEKHSTKSEKDSTIGEQDSTNDEVSDVSLKSKEHQNLTFQVSVKKMTPPCYDENAIDVWEVLREHCLQIENEEPNNKLENIEKKIAEKEKKLTDLKQEVNDLENQVKKLEDFLSKKEDNQEKWKSNLHQIRKIMEQIKDKDRDHNQVMEGYRAKKRDLTKEVAAAKEKNERLTCLNRRIEHQGQIEKDSAEFQTQLNSLGADAEKLVREVMAMVSSTSFNS